MSIIYNSYYRHTYPHKLFRFILLKSQDNRPVEPMHSTASQPDVKCFFQEPRQQTPARPTQTKEKNTTLPG